MEVDGSKYSFKARRLLFKEQQAIYDKFAQKNGGDAVRFDNPLEVIKRMLAYTMTEPWFECPQWEKTVFDKRLEFIGNEESPFVTEAGRLIGEFNNVETRKK